MFRLSTIAIILILGVGGVFAWQYFGAEQKADESREGKVTEGKIDTSSWQTYRNEEYGFEIKYPQGWRAHTNTFLGEPNMVFCPPEFFAEGRDWWISWSPAKEGCAAQPRRWAQNGTVLIEGTGEVSKEEFAEQWEARLADPVFSVYLFLSTIETSPREDQLFLGQDSQNRSWIFSPGDLQKFPRYEKIFHRIAATFRFVE